MPLPDLVETKCLGRKSAPGLATCWSVVGNALLVNNGFDIVGDDAGATTIVTSIYYHLLLFTILLAIIAIMTIFTIILLLF